MLKVYIEKMERYRIREGVFPLMERANACFTEVMNEEGKDVGNKGWIQIPDETDEELSLLLKKAKAVREDADILVLVGVGGSNQAARAVIKALGEKGKTKIVYGGNTLSAVSVKKMLEKLEGKSVYINVIAKNFETLEPGSHFRVLRAEMEKRYSKEEMTKRVILTGTKGSRLEEIAKENGYTFLSFPLDIGGRYSAFSPVALFPLAVAGLDIKAYLAGAKDQKQSLLSAGPENDAVVYAAYRNYLYRRGYSVEVLTQFEPQLDYFMKWWVQLFGESEGKEYGGIYPSCAGYSEDLHSLGQYMQSGRRDLIETFLSVKEVSASVVIQKDRDFRDGFDYLDGVDFKDINKAAEKATIQAHSEGGVPCFVVELDRIDEYHFGALFYFFMVACAVSGKVLGINPFDQEGVEEYKRSTFRLLGKQ